MNGIFITNNTNAVCIKSGDNNVYDAIKFNNIYAQRNTNNKFLNDKCFVLDKDNIYIYI